MHAVLGSLGALSLRYAIQVSSAFLFSLGGLLH